MAKVGVSCVKNLFKKPFGCPIQDVIEVVNTFSVTVTKEMNQDIEEEVFE